MEKWIDIHGFNGEYRISNRGSVVSLKSGNPICLKNRVNADGYLHVALRKEGKAHEFLVHRLVALHFIPNPANHPTVNHEDGNKLNNAASNLKWTDRSGQMEHAYRLGLKRPMSGSKNKRAVLTDEQVEEIRGRYKGRCKVNGMMALAKEFGVNPSTIERCVRRETYRSGNV